MNRKMEELILAVLEAEGAVEIRNVDGGEEPFLYASGNWGPGYISIKGLVGRKQILKPLAQALGRQVLRSTQEVDFVGGNVTGGMIPGWLLSEYLEVPYVYIRGTRKKGGQKELITGIANNPEIPVGSNGLVVEELANFAQTTCHGAAALRSARYEVTHGACIMFYANPEAVKRLRVYDLKIVYLFTLPQLLLVAEKHETHPQGAIDGYREFLEDPLAWQADRGFEPVEEGGTK